MCLKLAYIYDQFLSSNVQCEGLTELKEKHSDKHCTTTMYTAVLMRSVLGSALGSAAHVAVVTVMMSDQNMLAFVFITISYHNRVNCLIMAVQKCSHPKQTLIWLITLLH